MLSEMMWGTKNWAEPDYIIPSREQILKLLPKGSEIIKVELVDYVEIHNQDVTQVLFEYRDEDFDEICDEIVDYAQRFEKEGLFDAIYLYGIDFYNEWKRQIKEKPEQPSHELFESLSRKLLKNVTMQEVWNSRIHVVITKDESGKQYSTYPFQKKLH